MPTSLRLLRDHLGRLGVRGRLRAHEQVERQLYVALLAHAVALTRVAGVVEQLVRLVGVVGVVLGRLLVEALVVRRAGGRGRRTTCRGSRSRSRGRGRPRTRSPAARRGPARAGLNFASGQFSFEHRLKASWVNEGEGARTGSMLSAFSELRSKLVGSTSIVASISPSFSALVDGVGGAVLDELDLVVAPASSPRKFGLRSIVTMRPRVELGDDVRPAADQRELRLVGAGELLDRRLAVDVLGDDVDEQAADDAGVGLLGVDHDGLGRRASRSW